MLKKPKGHKKEFKYKEIRDILPNFNHVKLKASNVDANNRNGLRLVKRASLGFWQDVNGRQTGEKIIDVCKV